MLKLMYITNQSDVAKVAEAAGVDRIFVDMEYIGKDIRQGGMDTVQSRHTAEDVRKIADSLSKSELLVRVNPIHEATDEYCSSKQEIDSVIENGAKVVMLPYFKTVFEVEEFIRLVAGRAKVMLLIETPQAVEIMDDILEVEGIDEVFVGLNDLSLGYGLKFMFELLTNGIVEDLCYKFRKKGIPYGFGGIAALGKGLLPAEKVIIEHYRLGSSCAILSRSFCNTTQLNNISEIQTIFEEGLKEIRSFEKSVSEYSDFFKNNSKQIADAVNLICNK